jgi:hypothetical protein
VKALARRVGPIEGRRLDPAGGPPLVVPLPDAWPAGDRAALASGDLEARDDAIVRRTGTRPGPAMRLVVVVTRRDGPR